MMPAQALSSSVTNWQQWDGRIVNARFPLRQYLGGSEHSAIYLTECNRAKAAIKLVAADAPGIEAQLASWKLAGRISHPNLVKIVETGLWHADEEQDMHFAVMEYCDESLARVLRERTITADEARVMLPPILDALKFLHAQGLLHGQIKPAHILASGDQLKLSSDTIHCNGDAHPSSMVSIYDAPERGAGTISLSGDVWSLGITLYEALTNCMPGRPKDGTAELPEKLSPPFDAIVRGCLARDRERRLSVSAIRSVLDQPVPQAVKATAEPEPPKQSAEVATAPTQPASAPPEDSPKLVVIPTGAAAKPALEKATPPETKSWEPVSPPATSKAPMAAERPAEPTPQESDRRTLLLIAAAVVLVLAIALGLRLMHGSADAPAPAVTTTAPQPSVAAPVAKPAIAAPAAPSVAASVIHQVMPEISAHARNSIHGTVKVRVRALVDQNGHVSSAKLAQRGPSPYFARQALDAAKHWSFAAPVHNGAPQASEWTIRFDFRKSGTKADAQLNTSR